MIIDADLNPKIYLITQTLYCIYVNKIYVGDIKQTLGLECDDIEVFEKLRDKFSNDASFTTHLEKFVDFARVLLQSSYEDLEINNPLLESDGAT